MIPIRGLRRYIQDILNRIAGMIIGMRLKVKKRFRKGQLVRTKRMAKPTPIRNVSRVVPTAKNKLFLSNSKVRGLAKSWV